jgi:hypothetical protein
MTISKGKKMKKRDPLDPVRMKGFTKAQNEETLKKMILTGLNSIVTYKSPCGFNVNSLTKITDIELQTPLDFQQRFFLIMDMLYPSLDFARFFIKREHPEVLFLFNWLCKLYTDEAEISDSSRDSS